ncbi:MAG: hypothetical protein GX131_09950 [candidate division WS1 bacterium]|nr:hypothetical protein [candidate division WS1 bacterium]
MTAQVDKGAMIELRIDAGRITQLAPLHLVTPLDDAAIVAPADGELAQIAEELQRAIAERMGLCPPLLEAAGFAGTQELPRHLIALGNAANNLLLRRMHDLQQIGDRDYPAEGLRVISIHSPFGDGRNVIAVLGAEAEVVRAGVERMLALVEERDGGWLLPGRVFEVRPAPDTPDPEELLSRARKARNDLSHGRPGGMIAALGHLNASGEERWARAFIELVRPCATGEIPLSFALMSAVDFWTHQLVVGWDRAEEFPFFSNEERLMVANFIASCTEYCHDSITSQKWRITPEEHQIFNHHTFPARSLFFGTMYLRRHGYEIGDLDHWLDQSLQVFARAALAGRSFDEGGGGYSWLVGNHLLEVMFALGDREYARSEKLLHYADLATVVLNSEMCFVPYGDSSSYYARMGSGGAGILLRAAEWHGNGGCRWLAERAAPEAAAGDLLSRHVAAEEPSRHLGLFVLPLDPVIHRWCCRPRFPGYPQPQCLPNVTAEEGFDKLTFRGGWEEDADYLLLQGFGDGSHGHPDANSISQFQVRGRILLADGDYIRRSPRHHNTIMVIRDGEHAPVPVAARLDEAGEFPGGAFSRTSLLDYNGCDWQRTLLWLNGDCVLCIDSLEAAVAGDYELRCYWRTLGDATLTESGLHADHAGEHFHLLELDGSERRLDVEGIPLNGTDYPEYRFGDPAPKVMAQTRRAYLKAGERVCFVNLLLPNGEEVAPRRVLARDGDAIVVGGEGPAIRVAARGFEIDGQPTVSFSSDSPPCTLADTATRGPAQEVALPAMDGAISSRSELPAPATCLCDDGADGLLVGCEDGSVMHLGPDGVSRLLTQADGRIGAILAGPIFGEAEPTWMVTSWDASLRLLYPDGGLRARVELPRNGHMPAWGRALALADLDGDGRLWPIVGTASWRVHAISPDWSFRWTFPTTAHSVTRLAVADINGDGRDEIAVGTVYFCVPAITADGERLWADEDYNDFWSAGPNFTELAAADVDGDGRIETLAAASDALVHCISHEGEKRWTRSIGDEPGGMVVTSRGIAAASRTGDLHMIDGAGDLLWRTSLGSPCTCLALADEQLIVGLEDGRVVRLDLDGSAIGGHALPGTIAHLLATGDGRIAAAGGDATLHILELPTG